jgi:hypothetical protein
MIILREIPEIPDIFSKKSKIILSNKSKIILREIPEIQDYPLKHSQDNPARNHARKPKNPR